MKNKFFTLLSCLFIVFLFSCKSNDPQHIEQEKLNDGLMAVHDEVMPKMGHVNSLRKKLQNYLKENQSVDVELQSKINETIEFLEDADDGMMDWMGEYKAPSKLRKDKSHEEILAYLNVEQQKVEKVKSDILESIAQAEELIQSLGIK